jgi:uncharacterized heparinase superfamily protein
LHRLYGKDALAAARRGDAAEAERLIGTWVEAHPPRNAEPWHPYPLSTRVGNWIAALTLVPSIASPELSASLWRQLRRLERNVEDDVLGHHLMRNARALVLGGTAFGAAELSRRGIELLRRELPEQVLPDGGHYERSPSYHLFVLRDLLEIQAVSPHSWLAEAIERMRAFGAALQRPDGAPALFNDGTVDSPRLDLPDPLQGLAVFPDTGFVVVREGQLWLAFRCGPAAPCYVASHAHADALSLQLWWQGKPVLVDPGTSTYEPGSVRDWERSTRAHSTVCVDERDQLRSGRAFGRTASKVSLRYARDGALEASVVLPRRIRHVRRIEWDAASAEVVIYDQIEGKRRHGVDSRLIWAPELPDVELGLLGSGELTEEQVRICERYGEHKRATATVARLEAELPVQIGLRLRLPR